MAKETMDVDLCVDCAYLLANGEPEDHEENWDAEEAGSRLAEYEVTFGSLDEEKPEFVDFATWECFGCGTILGGTRYAATAWWD